MQRRQEQTLQQQPQQGPPAQYQQPQMAQGQPAQFYQQPAIHPGAIRQSRIKDRPQPKETRDSSLKIKIELDLEAEVDLYARVKGDITVGLM